MEPVTSKITYVGPVGQESPLFGALEPGQTYQADEAFAAYLVMTHPDFWQRADGDAAAAKE